MAVDIYSGTISNGLYDNLLSGNSVFDLLYENFNVTGILAVGTFLIAASGLFLIKRLPKPHEIPHALSELRGNAANLLPRLDSLRHFSGTDVFYYDDKKRKKKKKRRKFHTRVKPTTDMLTFSYDMHGFDIDEEDIGNDIFVDGLGARRSNGEVRHFRSRTVAPQRLYPPESQQRPTPGRPPPLPPSPSPLPQSPSQLLPSPLLPPPPPPPQPTPPLRAYTVALPQPSNVASTFVASGSNERTILGNINEKKKLDKLETRQNVLVHKIPQHSSYYDDYYYDDYDGSFYDGHGVEPPADTPRPSLFQLIPYLDKDQTPQVVLRTKSFTQEKPVNYSKYFRRRKGGRRRAK